MNEQISIECLSNLFSFVLFVDDELQCRPLNVVYIHSTQYCTSLWLNASNSPLIGSLRRRGLHKPFVLDFWDTSPLLTLHCKWRWPASRTPVDLLAHRLAGSSYPLNCRLACARSSQQALRMSRNRRIWISAYPKVTAGATPAAHTGPLW